MPHKPDNRIIKRETARRVELTGRDDLESAKNRVMKTLPQHLEVPKPAPVTVEEFLKEVQRRTQ